MRLRDGTIVPGVSAPKLSFQQARAVGILASALASLPRRQRAVIALHHLDGMTEQEVAQALGLSLGTVKTHARRGAEALRLRLGDSFKEVSFDTD